MCEQALEIAQQIAANSPIAVIGTKDNLVYARDHSVAEGLKYEATWNMVMLQTEVALRTFPRRHRASVSEKAFGFAQDVGKSASLMPSMLWMVLKLKKWILKTRNKAL